MPAVMTTYTLTEEDVKRATQAGVLRYGQKAGDKVPVVSTGTTETTVDQKDEKTGEVKTKPVKREHGTAFLLGGGLLTVTIADTEPAPPASQQQQQQPPAAPAPQSQQQQQPAAPAATPPPAPAA